MLSKLVINHKTKQYYSKLLFLLKIMIYRIEPETNRRENWIKKIVTEIKLFEKKYSFI